MDYLIGAALGFAAFILAYGVLAGCWAFVVAKTTPLSERSQAYDQGKQVPFLLALGVGGLVFYLLAF